jgi:hypothetical protein
MAGGPVGLLDPAPQRSGADLRGLLDWYVNRLPMGLGVRMMGDAVDAAPQMARGLLDSGISGATAVRDAIVDPVPMLTNQDETIRRAMDLGGLAATGSLGASAPAGAVRTFGGVKAATADRAALQRAEEMAAAGVPREEVWSATGWFQGNDGKWRFEINDIDAHVPLEVADRMEIDGGYVGRIDQALNHDLLWQAYPGIADTKAALEFGPANEGAFAIRNGKRLMHAKGPSPARVESASLHELQHAIQQGEGFAAGGSPDAAIVQRIADREAESAMNRAAALIDEREKFIDDWLAQKGITRSNWKFNDERAAAIREWDSAHPDKSEELAQARNGASSDPYEVYRRLAGEVEARNVQRRRLMNADERRATPPWQTQDVPDDMQFVLPQERINQAFGLLGGY